jgi:hypothetical protein
MDDSDSTLNMSNIASDMDTKVLPLFGRWGIQSVACLFLGFILITLLRGSSGSSLPTINDKGRFEFSDKRIKKNFVFNGRRLLLEGLKKFKGKPFRMLTDFGPAIILPPDYAQEIRNIESLNHAQAIAKVV